MTNAGKGWFDHDNRDNDDDTQLHEQIQFAYDALKANSTHDARNRLVIASEPLIAELAKRFVKRYPQLKQDINDLKQLAASILAEAAFVWVDKGKFSKGDIAAFICKLVWDAMKKNRIENNLVRIPQSTRSLAEKHPNARYAKTLAAFSQPQYLAAADFDLAPKQASHADAVIDGAAALDLFPPRSMLRAVVNGVLDGKTGEQIAAGAGVDRAEISRLKKQAAAVLKEHFGHSRIRATKTKPRRHTRAVVERRQAIDSQPTTGA